MSKIIWRVCEATFAESAFSGEGASIVGGRWNSKGKRMVYTAENLSLAILEVFVHLNVPTVERNFFVAIKAEIPDNLDVEYMNIDRLPSDWYLSSSKSSLQALGDEWIDSTTTLILAVSSAIVPQEFNYLINPLHPQFDRLSIVRSLLISIPECGNKILQAKVVIFYNCVRTADAITKLECYEFPCPVT